MDLNRRQFVSAMSAACATTLSGGPLAGAQIGSRRLAAMLLGSLIGDALGGPIEFLPAERVREIMPAARTWEDGRTLDPATITRLAESLTLFSYQQLRPETAAYGPWLEHAAEGTITDDSRHKIVLMRAMQLMLDAHRPNLMPEDLANAYLTFTPLEGATPSRELAELVDEGMREYRMASRWVLGQRDLDVALPLERLWGGVSNCSGQMALLPLAGVFPGQPERAYLETFRLDFIDAPIARDIAAAINAGLSAVLGRDADGLSEPARWELLMSTIRRTDPYRFSDVPFAGRQLDRWMDLANSIVERSEGSPKVAFRLLESEGKPVYYWDSHFTLLVPLTLLKLCKFDPLAALHLTLDFGHDTDSYAQLVGAMAGAVHGMELWRSQLSAPVISRLSADYGESVEHWEQLVEAASARWVEPLSHP